MSKIIGGITSIFRAPKATERAAGHITSGAGAAQEKLQPYMDTGTQANSMLQNALSTGAIGGTFTPGDLTKDPGYQFNLAQGTQALNRRAVAPGGSGYFSGAALKEAQEFGQGLADRTYNDAYNRWLQEQQNRYGVLSRERGAGYDAASQYGKYATGIGETMADATLAKEKQRMGGLAQLLSFGR